GDPEPCEDLLRWAHFLEYDERRIVRQQRWRSVDPAVGEVFVSTVFLGIDHNFGDGPPVLWETMAWIGDEEICQRRWTRRTDAIAGHNAIVAELGGPVLE